MARRCLVIHPGALGDVLLALPALAHLAVLFPGAARVLATAPRLGALLHGSACVEETADVDALGLHPLFVADPDPEALARFGGYHAIVSWLGAGDPAYCAHLARLGCPVVVAGATPAPGSRTHAARHLLDTIAPLGPVPGTPRPVRLGVGDDERRWARAWLEGRGLRPGEAVVLHPGAGSPAKVWPGFGALARRLRATGQPVVVVAGPADSVPVAQAIEGGGLADTVVARDWPLRRLAALLEAARAFVGNDSGLSHLAAAVGCQSLVLFGPTDPVVWTPLGERVVVLAGSASGARDPWRELTPDRVEDALAVRLGRARPALAG